jgi:hypothetical protein
MSVILPTYPGPRSAALRPVDAGSWQLATVGGVDVRLDRLGDRFALAVYLPPMKWDTIDGVSAARVWAVRLARGLSEGVIMEVPQPDFDTSGFQFDGGILTTAAQSTIVEIAEGMAGKVYREGMMVTLKKAATGVHYLHQVRADAIAAGGVVALSLWPRTRTAFGGADVALVRTPVIEGRIVEPSASEMEEIRTVGLSFEVQEIR